jgi:serine/threonine-protein kinase HipA
MTRLDVFYGGWGEHWHLGTLADKNGIIYFEYAPQAVAQGLELSPLKLPLPKAGAAPQIYSGLPQFSGLPGFIADALPDGWGMLLMDKALRRQGRDPASVSVLERLAMVGANSMGALTFEPHQDEVMDARTLDLLAIAKDMARIQAEHTNVSNGGTTNQITNEQLQYLLRLGGSPQGARPKALVDMDGAAWLVKFPAQGEHPEVCAMEELYARFVRPHATMPPSRLFELGKQHSAFAVQRFDRALPASASQSDSTPVLCIPMLSLAALLHADYRLPSLDYETVLLATTRLTGDLSETAKAFELAVINALLHNRDDHAKNIAYCLNAHRQWTLSPIFDLTYSTGPGGEHSTSYAGEGARPTRARLLQVAKTGGLRERQAIETLDYWLDALAGLPTLAKELPIRAKTMTELKATLNRTWNDLRG